MMTISLQPTITSSPMDGLLVKSQSRDLVTVQPSSFREVFKDEEKKLQKEQETSAFSVAAVLAANPVPSNIESAPVLNSEIGTEKWNSEKQTVLQSESVAVDLTGLLPIAGKNGQGKMVAGDKTAGVEVNTSIPVSEIPQATVNAVENVEVFDAIKLKSEIDAGIEKPVLSTIGHSEITSVKPEVEIKAAVEMQPRVDVPVPVSSDKAMIVPNVQSDKPGIPTAIRLEVARENPVVDAKTIPVLSQTSATPPVVSDTAKAVSEVQNEKMNAPTVPGVQIAGEKTDMERNTVESQSRVPAVGVPNEVLAAPEIKNEKIKLPVPVRVDIGGGKTVVEAKAVEAQPRVSAPASVISDKVAVAPEIQSEKIDIPVPVRAEIDGEKIVVDAKGVEAQPRVAASAPVISDKVEAVPEVPSEKISLPIPVNAQVASEKSVEEPRTAEMQSLVPALGTSDGATAVSGIKNGKPGNPTVIGAQAAGEKTVEEAKTGTQQPAKSNEVKTVSSEITMATAVSDSQRQSEKTSVVVAYEEPEKKNDPITFTAATVNESGVVTTAEKLTTSQVNVQSSEVVQQIMSQMKVRIKSGTSSMRLQLNPKELGRIEVQMIRIAEGVSVTFYAENASTGHLLETQMNQLRQSLKDAGVQLTGLNISQQDQPKQEGGFFKQRPFLDQYFQDDTPQVETVNKEWERRERIGGSLNEVDYLI